MMDGAAVSLATAGLPYAARTCYLDDGTNTAGQLVPLPLSRPLRCCCGLTAGTLSLWALLSVDTRRLLPPSK